MKIPAFGRATAKMLFEWLFQLDLRATEITIPSPPDVPKLEKDARQRIIEGLRTMAFSLAANAPTEHKPI